jgi:hypothetical protein
MKAAITTLRTKLEVLEHNEAIHRKEGRDGQADTEAAEIAEIREGITAIEDRQKVDAFIKEHDPLFDRWLTFDEFVDIGRKQGVPCYGEQNMPWSFSVCGYPVTHENDDHYIVTADGYVEDFYRGHEIRFSEEGVSTRSVP